MLLQTNCASAKLAGKETSIAVKGVDELLGQVLGQVIQKTGSVSTMEPVWKQAVGALAARHTRPVRQAGSTLVIRCDGVTWRDALEAQQKPVLQKLCQALGASTITALAFEVE